METILFYLFATVLIFSALKVVTVHNAVHAVLYLMMTFAQAGCLWLLLRAEFLAVALILVYLGAVMVLFIFVVMMLDIRPEANRRSGRYFAVGATVGILTAAEMIAVVVLSDATRTIFAPERAAVVNNVKALGRLLYTDYVYPIQIAAAILLAGMIAAIVLVHRKRAGVKPDPAGQIRAHAGQRYELLDMKPVLPAPAAAQENQEGGQA